MLAHEVADPAAEGDASEPDRARVAEPDREAVGGGSRRELPGRQAGFGPCGPSFDVDLEPLHIPQVQDHASVRAAVAGATVPTAAHGELRAGFSRHADDLSDVGRVGHAHDGGGAQVELARDDEASFAIVGILWRDHPTAHVCADLRN